MNKFLTCLDTQNNSPYTPNMKKKYLISSIIKGVNEMKKYLRFYESFFIVLITLILTSGILCSWGVANAAQFESVIAAMAIKNTDTTTNNGWESTLKIKGVKWKWPYYESGAHDSTVEGKTKVGKDKNPNIGSTEIRISGPRTMISKISIVIANTDGFADESSIRHLFGKGKIKKINTSCDSDYATNADATYQFVNQGYKPLYINYTYSSGAGGFGTVGVTVAYELDDLLGSECKAK